METRTEQDERVLRALAADLDAGFVELFQAFQDAVFATTLRMCGRWEDAEDLAAEAFLRAYRALTTYDRSRLLALQPRSWLLTITLNVCRNQHRNAARSPVSDPLELCDQPDPTENVEEAVDERLNDGELSTLLGRLPHDQRAAIVLRHVVGLSVAEIADILGRPAGTVKSDVSRGLARLRQLHRPSTTEVRP